MKIFLDTANFEEIKQAVAWGIIDGITTNPSLLKKEAGKDLKEMIQAICSLVKGPVSVEVNGFKAEEMIEEARQYFAWDPKYIVIKVPMCEEGLKAIHQLKKEKIPCNCTLIFSLNQAILAVKAGARYISPFVGRLDDIGENGMVLIDQVMNYLANYDEEAEVISASIRHPLHVVDSALLGAHIATIPFQILKKMFHHPLTEKGIETFSKDWESFKKNS
jgi:transaldolase